MKRILSPLGLAAMVLAVAAAPIAYAGGAYNPSSGGCAGWGLSYVIDVDYSYSKTDASQSGNCANSYSDGYFYDGSSYVNNANGWESGSISLSEWYNTAYAVTGYHKLCNSAPPCGNLWLTTAP